MKLLKYTKARGQFEEKWLSNSLEELENDNWGAAPMDESYTVATCYGLRKKALSDFEIEDYRLLIGQNIGLKFLIPLSIQILEQDVLAEGDFYEGDLLKAVLTCDKNYWKVEIEDRERMVSIVTQNLDRINKEAEEYNTGKGIILAFEEFKNMVN